ncbi:LexA family transcriptional regulator [Pseudomonas soli]|uniref:LexA family transcriptional regulator n=1 Tax=Pseudomonas soli TaxID=1306993 RepID=A0ABU7GWH7_9PSED|nr:LexA family transcriptional regulator [Pseudomonas soli]MEE1883369.1 LexA family transcriptional regulator [Pseudomonas soli]
MFDPRRKISARLAACRERKNWTYRETAEQLSAVLGKKIGTSRYGNWEQGINVPPHDMLIALGKVFDVPPSFLGGLSDDEGAPPETSNYVVPPLSTVPSNVGVVDLGDNALAFQREFLERNNLDRQKILLIAATDDSMAPRFQKNDLVLIDLSETTVSHDDMFAIMISGRPRLRWIRQDLKGDYVIQAEKRDYYPDETISAETLKDMHILGRVRMIAQLR